MKTVILLRHAKSAWNTGHQSDHERPLKKRGRKDARRVGRMLARTGQLPDLVLCSTAVRARQTLEEVVEGGDWPPVETELTDALYEAMPEAVLSAIQRAPDEAGVLLLVGHDPAWSDVAGRLVGLRRLAMTTGASVRVDLEVNGWQEVAFGKGTLAWFAPPELLGKGKG